VSPLYRYSTSVIAPPYARLAVDTGASNGTPAVVYNSSGGLIDQTQRPTGITASGAGRIPDLLGDTATVYVRQLDYRGTRIAGVIATIAGTPVTDAPSGGAAAGIDDTTPSTSSVYSSAKTTAAISAAITSLINASPAALDTLKELADALGDDANFAATITTALAGKVAISAIGAANGVAGLDASGHQALAALPMGAEFHITSPDSGTTWKTLDGTTITARPTSRTDLRMICETAGTAGPSWAIAGDLLFRTT